MGKQGAKITPKLLKTAKNQEGQARLPLFQPQPKP
jgi:hypothetical protein